MESKALYVISKDGQGSGGFLSPPGHPNHEYVVYGYYKGRKKAEPDSISGIGFLISNEYGDVSEAVQARAVKIMADAQLVCSERWVRSVYGYFRNSYAPYNGSRNVSDAVGAGPAGRHLGYLMVHQYFPEHEPREDLIADPGKGYGSYPCAKCGQTVQYEARVDALAVVKSGARWTYDPVCPKGGQHLLEGEGEPDEG